MPSNTNVRALIGALLAGTVTLAWATNAPQSIESHIKQLMESRFPNVKVVDVQPSPMPGIFEVYTGDNIAYTDRSAEWIINGPLIETRSQRNLTNERIDARRSIDFSELPLDKAIRTVRGNGKRTIAVFSDPDCPF